LNDGGSKEIKERNGGGAEEVVAGKGRNKGKIDRNIGIERERERERLKRKIRYISYITKNDLIHSTHQQNIRTHNAS
jgi:hypothetical protein